MPALAQQPTPDVSLDGAVRIETAPLPPSLSMLVEKQLAAANQQDLDGLLSTYSPEFRHGDGLNLEQTRRALSQLWKTHEQLRYRATVRSWQQRGPDLIANIITEVTGSQLSARGKFQMRAVTEVRNRYRPDFQDPSRLLLISQEVLREATTLTSGPEPPQLLLKLPERVRPGATYRLEAIVQNPLKDEVILGTVIEEALSVDEYLNPATFPLEPLRAGGLFRRGEAPPQPGTEWVSVMLVGRDGLTLESRRLVVSNQTF